MAPGRPALAASAARRGRRDRAPGHGRRRLGHRRHEPDPRRRRVAAVLQLDRDRARVDGAHPAVRAGVGGALQPAGVGRGLVAGPARRHRLSGRDVGAYTVAQTVGGVAGAVLANVMFDVPTTFSTHDRSDWHLWVGEVVATAGLVALIFALARTGRGAWAAPAVGAYIGAAYWFTSSTSFANPSVTVGRMFSDTFAGIAPSSVPGFVVAQVVGAAFGVGLVLAVYPDVAATAGRPRGRHLVTTSATKDTTAASRASCSPARPTAAGRSRARC